eukprot:2661892-Rhodomonas_salina.1
MTISSAAFRGTPPPPLITGQVVSGTDLGHSWYQVAVVTQGAAGSGERVVEQLAESESFQVRELTACGSGVMAQGLGVMAYGLGVRAEGLGLRVHGLGRT